MREWRAKNAAKERDRLALYRAKNPKQTKNRDLRRAFGITFTDYQALIEGQDSRCGACQTDLRSLRSSEVQVDHCHTSGVIRGILCGPCNRALGHLKDDPERIKMLLAYMQATSA